MQKFLSFRGVGAMLQGYVWGNPWSNPTRFVDRQSRGKSPKNFLKFCGVNWSVSRCIKLFVFSKFNYRNIKFNSIGNQSPCQRMIGVYNNLLRKVKLVPLAESGSVIGSLETCCVLIHVSLIHVWKTCQIPLRCFIFQIFCSSIWKYLVFASKPTWISRIKPHPPTVDTLYI